MRSALRYLPILGVLVFWGLSWPLTKASLQYMSPCVLALFRFATGALVFSLLSRTFPRTPKVVFGALLNGVFFVTMVNFAVQACRNPALASSLVYTQPLFVVLFSVWFFRERLHALQIFGVFLGFSGILIAAGSVHFDRGVVLAIASGFLWSLGILYYRKYLREEDLLAFNAALNVFSTLGLLFFLPFDARFSVSPQAFFWGFATACSAQVGGFFLWFLSLKTLGAVTSGTFSLLVPVVAYCFTYPILAQIPTPLQVLGSALTLSGVFLARWKSMV